MSPEQARGQELDRRTDIFSMGIVMYEMATGEAPFTGNTWAVIFDAILNREPPPVLERNAALPAELGHIIHKALEKDRRLRYQSAADLYADLQRLKRDSSSHGTPGLMRSPPAAGHKARAWLALTGSLLLIMAIAVTAVLLRPRRDHTVLELVPRRVTSNNSDAAVQSMALSPDGKYLAYSDVNGVHVRSVQTGDSRVFPDTKDMVIQYWAADSSQFFLSEIIGGQYKCYSVSLPGGIPHNLGKTIPSHGGQYSVTLSNNSFEIRGAIDGKMFPVARAGVQILSSAWSPLDKRVAVSFVKPGPTFWIEVLDLENGHWTTLISPAKDYLGGLVWLSDKELIYARVEPRPRGDMNLWTIKVDPSTDLPSGAPQRRTQWADFHIEDLSANADASRLCFLRSNTFSDIFVGDLRAHASRLVSVGQLFIKKK
jgi:serine/threonine protein kinase